MSKSDTVTGEARQSARSSISTWTPSMRRWSSGTIRTCAANPSPWAAPRTRRRRCRELRGARVRGPLGHAVGHRQAPMSRPDFREAALRGLQGGLAGRSARSSPSTRRSSSRCRSTRPISTSPRTCKASRSRTQIAPRSARGSGPRRASPPRPASPTTSSWPSSPPTIASPTASS